MHDDIRKAFYYVLTSIVFLLAAFGMEEVLNSNVLLTILREGLFIGGWVFLWEAVATTAFKKKILKNNRRKYERLRDADVRFRYDQESRVSIYPVEGPLLDKIEKGPGKEKRG